MFKYLKWTERCIKYTTVYIVPIQVVLNACTSDSQQ